MTLAKFNKYNRLLIKGRYKIQMQIKENLELRHCTKKAFIHRDYSHGMAFRFQDKNFDPQLIIIVSNYFISYNYVRCHKYYL